MKLNTRSSALTYLTLFSLLLSLSGFWTVGAQSRVGSEKETARFEALSAYAQDLTASAQRGAPAADDFGAGVRSVLRVFARREGRNNPLLVTDDAAGSRAVVEALARRVAGGEVPAQLRGKRILALDAGRMLADAKGGAEFGRRFAAVLRDVKSADGRVVLFVENMDGLLASADERQSQAALDLLAGEVSRGAVRLIGAVSPAAFELKLAQNEALKSRLQEIYLDRPEQSAQADEEDKDESSDEDQSSGAGFVGDKISPDLREALSGNGSDRVSLILQGDDLKNASVREYLKASGATFGGSFNSLGAQAVEVPLSAVKGLSEQQGVAHLSLDRELKALSDGHVSTTTGESVIEKDEQVSPTTGAVTVTKIDGKGIGIAILDSGIYAAHEEFLGRDGKSRIIYSKDFTGENRTDDPYGHGTHVAGLAAGNGQVAGGMYKGIAPDANIINLRVLNSQGTGTVSGLLNALNWVYNNRSTYNVRVVNMSLGSSAVDSYRNDPVCKAVRKLVDAGIVVAAAAGNDGKDANGKKLYGQIHSPGDEPSAITVGAANTFGTDSRADDAVATYSSRGPTRGFWTDASGTKHYDNLIKPDLVAPGNKLVSAESASNLLVKKQPTLDRKVSATPTSNMMTLSGTSMATPIVAGSAALMLQTNPKLTPNMVKALLMYTAQQLRGFNAFEQGAGELNIAGAITLAKFVRTDLTNNTPLGTPVFTKMPPPPYTTIAGYTFQWSCGIITGQTFATGAGLAFYQKSYALGTLMGDGITISEGVLMADHTVWTSGVLLGDNILTSNGAMMSDGTPVCSAGALLGDGVMLSDGVLISDGVLLGEGVMLSDGVLLGDSTRALLAMLNGDATASMTVVKDNGVVNLDY
ncbi:MAG TPA: S8 family serine peptidase [Pyrinomonadaceae bacterium]|jgi:subtilisin family serine protease|nr:S8 family serine peptidase [Pyrinomonadaceae bacterium]